MTPINEIRKEKGYTILEFAKALEVSESMIRKLLYGVRQPSTNILKRIGALFPDVDIRRLI